MSEHLLTFADKSEAQTERPDLFDEDGNIVGALVTQAITDAGAPPVLGEDGETVIEPGTPPTFADGYWVLLQSAIEADPITLPEGVLRLTVIYTDPMPAPVPQP